MDEYARRVGINETLFREVNERVRELEEGFGATTEPLSLVCECGDAGCTERLVVARDEYLAVRAHPTRFMVVPGHEIETVERIVDSRDRYLVVEKHEGWPARLAEERA